MIESVAPFAAYVLALGIAAAIPGPGVAAVVGRAMGTGARASLPFVLGLVFGDVLFLTVAVLGLSALAAAASGVFFVVKVAGGIYLLYLGWRFWTAKAKDTDTLRITKQGSWKAVVSGLAVTLGNPKTIVFYLALVPNVIDLTAVGPVDWIMLSLLTVSTLLAVMIPYAVLASRLRSLLTSSAARRNLNRGAGLIMGGAGGLIMSEAFANSSH